MNWLTTSQVEFYKKGSVQTDAPPKLSEQELVKKTMNLLAKKHSSTQRSQVTLEELQKVSGMELMIED